MLPLLRRRVLPRYGQGSKLCVVGDSIQDLSAWVGSPSVGNQCGLSTATLAATLGLSLVGLSASGILTAPGTLYTTNPTPTFTGGAPTVAAVATATVVAGGVRGLTFSTFGSGYGSAPALGFTGGGGSGAAGTLTISGGAVVSPYPNGGSSTDVNRSAISGSLLQTLSGSEAFVSHVTPRCLAYNPDVILLLLGMNDYLFATNTAAANPVTATRFRTALDTVLPLLKAGATHPEVIVGSVLPASIAPFGGVPDWASSAADALRQLNGHMAASAALNGCHYLDLCSFPVGSTVDGVHPTTDGHTWIADRMVGFFGRD